MGIRINHASFDRCRDDLSAFLSDLEPDLEAAGDAATQEVVASTLSGVGEGDTAFKSYAASYQKEIDQLAANAGTVNLRSKRRPIRGPLDPASEMSVDLINVETAETEFKLVYEPRDKPYMIGHQDTRPWFSLLKTSVIDAVMKVLGDRIADRVRRFNGRK